jgi:hypothetical protein
VQWVAGAWLNLASTDYPRLLSKVLTEPSFTRPLQVFAQEAPRHVISSSREENEKYLQTVEEDMRNVSSKFISPSVTIRVAGSLSHGHLSYLDQVVSSAIECALWPLLDLADLKELDHFALTYLTDGEGRHFGLVGCPNFIREWMQYEKNSQVA